MANRFKERDRYELEVESKKAEVPSLQVTPYKASAHHLLLKHLEFMSCFDGLAPEVTFNTLTSDNIEKYLKSLVKNTDQVYDPTQLRDTMVGLKFPVSIRVPAARITTYCADVFERLDSIDCDDFNTENPKHTITLLLERAKPSALKTAMFERIKVEFGLEKNLKLFTDDGSMLASENFAAAELRDSQAPAIVYKMALFSSARVVSPSS